MREFRNPFSIFSPPKARVQRAPVQTEVAASVTKDGDESTKKRSRGISSQRSTLLTAGSVTGQETRRRSLLGVSG